MESFREGLKEGWIKKEAEHWIIEEAFELLDKTGEVSLLLGKEWIHLIFIHGEDRPGRMPSIGYFCSRCGLLWGKRMRDPFDWVVDIRHCQKHGNGSFLSDFDDIISLLPRTLLKYELNAAVRQSFPNGIPW